MNTSTPTTIRAAALLENCLRAFRPRERDRLAAAILPDFAALLEDAGKDGTTPAEEWGRADCLRAVVDAVEYLAVRARLLDRLEDAYPALIPAAEYSVERKEGVA